MLDVKQAFYELSLLSRNFIRKNRIKMVRVLFYQRATQDPHYFVMWCIE